MILSGLFWIKYIILLIITIGIITIPIYFIKKAVNKNREYKQKSIQLLEEQNRLLREQLNRDK